MLNEGKAIEKNEDSYRIAHGVDEHHHATHGYEDDKGKWEVLTVASQETKQQDELDEGAEELKEQIAVGTCYLTHCPGEDAEPWFVAEAVMAEDVEVDVAKMNVGVGSVIASPVVAYISAKAKEDKEQEETRYPHTST